MKPAHIRDDGISITILRTPDNYIGPAIIGKIGKTYSDYSVGNKRMINCLLESALITGEIVRYEDESLLTVVSKLERIEGTPVSIIAHGVICNALLTVTRKEPQYDEYGNVIGETPTTIIAPLPCRADVVSARMRQEDPGLLATTLLVVYASYNASLKQLDKANIAGNDYQVDHIDTLKIPGVMVVQLGTWTGG